MKPSIALSCSTMVVAAVWLLGCESGIPGSTQRIGPEGGSVVGPDGASVVVPAGALSDDVDISVSVVETGFAALPALPSGRVYAFEPHGQVFESPVTITIPHEGLPGEVSPFTSEPGVDWTRVEGTVSPGLTEIEVTHFSFFFNGREVCGLYRQECCDDGDACAGDALTCVDGRCMGCGFGGGGWDYCCAGDVCYEDGTECIDGRCWACGLYGERCCADDVCADDSLVCSNDSSQFCGDDACCDVCGQPLTPCCPDGSCAVPMFECIDGICTADGLETCGNSGQVCCEGGVCDGDTECLGGLCVPCGLEGLPCCSGGVCDDQECINCMGGVCANDPSCGT